VTSRTSSAPALPEYLLESPGAARPGCQAGVKAKGSPPQQGDRLLINRAPETPVPDQGFPSSPDEHALNPRFCPRACECDASCKIAAGGALGWMAAAAAELVSKPVPSRSARDRLAGLSYGEHPGGKTPWHGSAGPTPAGKDC